MDFMSGNIGHGMQTPYKSSGTNTNEGVVTNQQPVASGDSSAPMGSASKANAVQGSRAAAADTIVQQLNQKLFPQGLEAVFQFDNVSRMTWINVINKASGQVVERWPPEKIREMVDQTLSGSTRSALSFDKRV